MAESNLAVLYRDQGEQAPFEAGLGGRFRHRPTTDNLRKP